MIRAASAALILAALSVPAHAADKWVTSWAASVQGPYPVGNPSAQPVQKFAFPAPEAGARDQTFRLIVMPEVWGKQARLRLSNALGKHEDFAREWHSGDRQTIVVHGDCLCVLGVDGAPEPSR